jgi:hypothetical protein
MWFFVSRHIHTRKANNILSELNTSNLQFSVATSVSWSELWSGAKCGFTEKCSQKASSTGIQVIRPGGIGWPDVVSQRLWPVQGRQRFRVLHWTLQVVDLLAHQDLWNLHLLYNKFIIRHYTTSFDKSIAWLPAPADQKLLIQHQSERLRVFNWN